MTNRRNETETASSTLPDDRAAISAAIVTLAQPLIEKHATNPKRVRSIVMLAVAAWNKAMLPAAAQSGYEKAILDAAVPPGEPAESMGAAIEVMDTIEERRRELFTDVRALITKYDLRFSESRFTLDVQSAPVAADSEALQ